jgi:hypothetical protein
MTGLSHDFQQAFASVESLKAYLAGVVRTATDSRNGEPVILTFVGGEFMKTTGTTFEKHLTALADHGQVTIPKRRRKLAQFIEAYCEDMLVTTKSAAGTYHVSPIDPEADAGEITVVEALVPSAFRFQRAVWAAFIRPLDGKRRFLNLDQIGFTDALEAPGGGNWKEIPEQFILGADADARINGEELGARIEEWARGADVPVSKLVMSPPPMKAAANSPTGPLVELLKIIDALPDDVAAQWSIPVSVLKHLRNSR